jgi:two-component system OmpR family sensor kinase
MGPIGHYVRSRLRRRLLLWFASGIAVTAVTVALVMSLLGRSEEPSWPQTVRTGSTWFAQQLARDWEDVGAREARARAAAAALGLDLELRDAHGARLLLVGPQCRHHPLEATVARDGVVLGSVRGCFRPPQRPGWRWGLG